MMNHQLIYCKWSMPLNCDRMLLRVFCFLHFPVPFICEETEAFLRGTQLLDLLAGTHPVDDCLAPGGPTPRHRVPPSPSAVVVGQGIYRQRPQRPPTALNLKVSKLLWILKLGDHLGVKFEEIPNLQFVVA